MPENTQPTPEEEADIISRRRTAQVLAGIIAAISALHGDDTSYTLRLCLNTWLTSQEISGIDCTLL